MSDTMNVGGLTVVTLETPSLGDRSYLVHDGRTAFVVDPQRDLDRVLELLDRHQVALTHVFETHIHNDYLTGGLALSRATGACYLVNGDDPVSFDRTPVRDADSITVGRMRVTALATPGHTFTHLSYALGAAGSDGLDTTLAVFTGGSLLFGTTGRPDLLGPRHTGALARLQHASAHRLVSALPSAAAVLPTHGFGSFCSSTQSDVKESTLGQEQRSNPALRQDEQTYVERLLGELEDYPAYYAHMAPANLAGPGAPDLSPPGRADPAELRRRIEAGEWVVDLRARTAFAAGHVPGSLNFGLDGGFATYVGWLMDWGTPITLLGSSPEDVAEAQRELVRIGIERPAAAATGAPEQWAAELRDFPVATFADLAQVLQDRRVTVLDVRRAAEHRAARVAGAVNIPIHELPGRLSDVPPGEVWVHCESGYRASVAASFLDAAGRTVVAVDDDFENAARRGVQVLAPSAVSSRVQQVLDAAVGDGVTPGAAWGRADGNGHVEIGVTGVVATHDEAGAPVPAAPAVEPTTLFDLASLTKVYTAVTVLSLAGKGVVDLQAPIGEWLPEYSTGAKERVTLVHLLSHTAGLPATWEGWRSQITDLGSPQARWVPRARPEVLGDLLAVDLVRDPGRDVEYSCLGYITAMAVAERATGARWDELVAEHLLRPLGLGDTTFAPDRDRTAPTERQPELGRPLVHGVVHDETAYALGGVSGNAGLFATVSDVVRFAQGLLEGLPGVLPEQLAARLWEDQLPALLGAGQADQVRRRLGFGHSLGLRIGQASFMGADAAQVRGHTGFTGTSLLADRDRGVAVVLLTNRVHPSREGPDLMPVRARVADLLRAGQSA